MTPACRRDYGVGSERIHRLCEQLQLAAIAMDSRIDGNRRGRTLVQGRSIYGAATIKFRAFSVESVPFRMAGRAARAPAART